MKINRQSLTMSQNGSMPALQLLTGVALAMLLPCANAVEVTKKATIATGVEYESNPALAETDKNNVWTYTLAPQFQLDVNDEVNRWYLDGALLIQRHSNEKVLFDREDPKLAIGWDRTYESGMFGVKAEYQESSARVTELTTTGVVSNADNTERNRAFSARWQHAISAKWAVLTEGIYNDATFSLPGSLDSHTLAEFRSQLSYANSENLDTFAQIGYSKLNPDKLYKNTDLARFMLGANYHVSERLSISPYAGIYNLSGRQSDTDWEAGIKADYTAERVSYSAGLGRDIVPSGVANFREVDSFTLGWQFNLSDRDQIGADFSLGKHKKDASIDESRLDYQQVGAFFERNLSDHWKTRLSAARKDLDTPDIDAKSYVIGVTLVYDTLSF